MAIEDQTTEVIRNWTGLETLFQTNIKAASAEDVVVKNGDINLTRNIHFTSELDSGTGYLIIKPLADMPSPPITLTISRSTPAIQPDNLSNSSSYDAEAMEKQLDRMIMVAQEIKKDASYAKEASTNAERNAAIAVAMSQSIVEDVTPPSSITGSMLMSGAVVANLGFTPENIANKNQNNGYAGIDDGGKILANLIPEGTLNLAQLNLIKDTVGGMLEASSRISITYDNVDKKASFQGASGADIVETGLGLRGANNSSNGKFTISAKDRGIYATKLSSSSLSFNSNNAHYALIIEDGYEIVACGAALGAGSPFGTTDITGFQPIAIDPNTTQPSLPWGFCCCGALSIFAIDSVGRAYALGRNFSGQLGLSDNVDRNMLTHISAITSPVSKIYPALVRDNLPAADSVYFLLTNGQLWASGSNGAGQLGDGTTTTRNIPVRCGTLTDVTKIVSCGFYNAGGNGHCGTMALCGTDLYAWGLGTSSALGNGSTSNVLSPYLTLANVADFDYCGNAQVSVGNYANAIAVLTNGNTKGIGYNGYGQIGDGTTIDKAAWVNGSIINAKSCSIAGNTAATSVFVLNDKTIKILGYNGQGQCGAGDLTSPKLSAVTPSGAFQGKVKKAFCVGYTTQSKTYILDDEGYVYACGYGSAGGLGIGNNPATQNIFKRIILPPFRACIDIMPIGHISTGGIAMLMDDNSVFVTGTNESGFFGLASTTGISTTRPAKLK